MKKINEIIINECKIDVYDEMSDLYVNGPIMNNMISILRERFVPIIEKEIKNQVSLGVTCDEISINAFVYKLKNNQYLICFTTGLLIRIASMIEKWIDSGFLEAKFKMNEDRINKFINYIIEYALMFVILHELGHVCYCSKRDNNFLYFDNQSILDVDNFKSQILEYAADYFATKMLIRLYVVPSLYDEEVFKCVLDYLVIALLIVFKTLSNEKENEFFEYIDTDITSYNHPYPGIRFHYCLGLLNEETLNHFSVEKSLYFVDYMLETVEFVEKDLFGNVDIKKQCRTIGITPKGLEHERLLINGWYDMSKEYEKYSWVHFELYKCKLKMKPVINNYGEIIGPNVFDFDK